jgi:cbb3-type cytochrome oxidase subunit 3
LSESKEDIIGFIGSLIVIYIFILFYLAIQGIPLTQHTMYVLTTVFLFIAFIGFLVFCGFSTKPKRRVR